MSHQGLLGEPHSASQPGASQPGASQAAAGEPGAGEPTILDLLDLEQVEVNLFRSCVTIERPEPLYGGQVAAQALYAAGQTVPDGRVPHSLHGYFLRAGSAALPTVFQVERDRDGRSFSARRVVAIQNGKVIFNMSSSFAGPRPGTDTDVDPAPAAPPPDGLPKADNPYLMSLETRAAMEPRPGWRTATRFWVKSTLPLPDSDLVHDCVLTYMSDMSSGLIPFESDGAETGPSLDHAVWFHRTVRMDDWVLLDLVPHSVAGGRGWYTGAVYRGDGARAASITQEALFWEAAV
ncbi:MAG TPA: acyl-CoA thioesterase domain-containing protein [Trebonia sp.]|jgi:acyl-CoA thioesterase-2